MSIESSEDIDRPDDALTPATSDVFVRGLSESIGGPLGTHAVRPTARSNRFWTAARIVLALTCLTLALSWVQKSPCQSGNWGNNIQYTRFCYTDVLALYYAEDLDKGQVPYKDHPVEYPVVTGYFMGLIGLPVHAYGEKHPEINQGTWFYDGNALVLSALAVATAAIILALRRRRPWDAAIFAVSPILFVTATVNWDFLAIGFAAIGLYLWAKKYPAWAGVFLGLGAAAKLWPLFILGPLFVLALRSRTLERWIWSALTLAVTWIVVNFPVWYLYHDSWLRFFDLNSTRPVDWGTLWYVGRYLDGKWRTGADGNMGPFQWLSNHIPALNYLTYGLFGLACVGILLLALLAPRRPRVAQLAFLVVAAFLIFSKVWSQQYVLWLLPLIVLARPRWGGDHRVDGRRDRILRRVLRRAARVGQQAGHPGGDVRAGLGLPVDHRGGAVRAGDSGDLAARAGRGAADVHQGGPGRRGTERARRAVDRRVAAAVRPGPRPEAGRARGAADGRDRLTVFAHGFR